MQRGVREWCSGIAVFTAVVTAGPLARAATAAARPEFVEGEVIVKFKFGTRIAAMSASALSAHAQASVARTMEAVGRPEVALVRFPGKGSVNAMVAAMRKQPGVEYAEPNYLAYVPEQSQPGSKQGDRRGVRSHDGHATIDARAALNPVQAARIDPEKFKGQLADTNDTEAAKQGGWLWVGADTIWPDAIANPMIAVLDSGVDYLHPDLTGRVVKGTDFINADADPMDDFGHGTHVAGIAAASTNNAKGIAGVSKAMIYAVKVLGSTGSGSYFDIAAGITQAANNPTVKIINMSLGGGCGSSTLTTAMQFAATKGKLIVVSMGNDNSNVTSHTTCPAAYADPAFNAVTAPVTVAVGAAGRTVFEGTCPGVNCLSFVDYSCKASYTNWATWMSILAPGTAIYSTTPYNRPFWLGVYEGILPSYDYLDGTSMAAPMVAGAAARTFSAMPAGTTAAQVKQRLMETGTPDIADGQGRFVDTNGDGTAETECWPSTASFNTNINDVFVPAAMKRAEVNGVAMDANGALGLVGANMTALLGAAPKGTPANVANYAGFYRILNVPMSNSAIYDIAVNKAGYTAANQKFTAIDLPDCGGGTSSIDCVYNFIENISVGANTANRYNLVTDWNTNEAEVDQYLFGPSASPLANCSVGYSGSCGSGALTSAPFMKHLHDGGFFSGSGPVEFTQIQTLQPQGAGTPYEVFATDDCLNNPPEPCGDYIYNFGSTFRLWKGGVLKNTVRASTANIATHSCSLGTGATGCDTWYIGDISSTGIFTTRNVFGVGDTAGGDPDGVLPYLRRPTENPRPGGPRGGPQRPWPRRNGGKARP